VHVGLNLVFLTPGQTGGMEIVARELITALAKTRPDIRMTAFVNRDAAEAGGPWADLAEPVTVPVRVQRRVEWVRGEQQLLPRLAAKAGVSLVHSLASTSPAWGPFRRVVTVHDLIYRLYPETHGRARALGMRVLVPLGVRRADRVTADSASTRDDLVRLLRVPPGKIDVVPLGVRVSADAAVTPEAELRSRLALGERPVVLTVGAKRPHKNLAGAIDALAGIPAERRPVLILVGYAVADHERELREHARALELDEDVRFVGWVDDADLEGLYGMAVCAVLPSLYEGFGLPVLEAMARGVPVICSNRSSVPEVAGGAAVLVDPERPPEITAALERVLADHALRERLRAAGRERAREFNWDHTARLVAQCYERALAGPAAA
jgi:glycosyltransferase involved in cell wall biosynthesis